MKRPALSPRLLRPGVLLAVGALAWLLLVAFFIWPSLRESRRQAAEISALDARAATLSGWHGGRALPADAARWKAELNARFERLFPPERRLEQLFMEIASAANASGVDPVQLRADAGRDPDGEGRGEQLSARGAGGQPEELEALIATLGISAATLPVSTLRAHRLRIDFEADYEHLARFTDALRTLERAVSVRGMQLRQGARGVAVQMELEYYVQER
ncbi:hypothetical protein FJ251_07265 [bacterium]|nr:hypothetical protein [bacterium]